MNLFKSAATVGGFTMMSRVFGFVRELLIASLLGTGPVADAFYAALRFPNLFRRLFAEGAFNAAFIPLFSKELEGGGEKQARQFSNEVFSILLVVLLALTALAEIFMPFLVDWVIAPGFSDTPEKQQLTVLLTRIMFPYLLCMSLVAMFSGILNSLGKFAVAAFATVLLNIVMIAVLGTLALLKVSDMTTIGTVMSWAWCASGFLQLGLLVWACWKDGFLVRFLKPTFTPRVKRMLILAVPASIAGGITQINLLIGQMIASQKDGAIAVLQFADRVYQLPLGVVGVAIGVALLPNISRKLQAGDLAAVNTTQNRALEFSMLMTIPAAVGIMCLAQPVINVLFERGQFTAADTASTAPALMGFAIGLPAFVLIKVFSPGFFAREDTKTPTIFAAISVIINIAGSLLLFPIYEELGIAIATTLSAWVNSALLWGTLAKRGHYSAHAKTVRNLLLMIAASVIMGAAVYFALGYIGSVFSREYTFFVRVGVLVGLVGLGALVFALVCQLTGTATISQFKQMMRRPQ
ncbi:MAG: murein biosynthesis integral membrane protein MurJ [Hyphomicrobiales bacterium]